MGSGTRPRPHRARAGDPGWQAVLCGVASRRSVIGRRLRRALFAMSTAWIVINSVGNQAEVSDHRVAAAQAAHGAASNLDQRIAWLRGRIADDAARVSDEIRGVRDGRRVQAGCGDVCRGLQRTIAANRALLIDVQRERAALVVPPINSKAAHWGAIACVRRSAGATGFPCRGSVRTRRC
jgi:hypothetical protein